jgi:hypothetical protein
VEGRYQKGVRILFGGVTMGGFLILLGVLGFIISGGIIVYQLVTKKGLDKRLSSAFVVSVALLIIGSMVTPGSKPEDLNKIEVRAEAQDLINEKGQTKVVVWVKNNSSKTYDGQVKVTSLDIDGSHLGFDGFYPKDLAPGKSTYGITWLKVAKTPNVKAEVLGGTFK